MDSHGNILWVVNTGQRDAQQLTVRNDGRVYVSGHTGTCMNIAAFFEGIMYDSLDLFCPYPDQFTGSDIRCTATDNEQRIYHTGYYSYYDALSGSYVFPCFTQQIVDMGVPSEIVEQAKNEGVIYPNPASDRVNIRFPGEGEAYIRLISMTGEVVLEQTIKMDTQLNIERYSPGVYLSEYYFGRQKHQ